MSPKATEIRIETAQTLDAMLHQILNQALVDVGAEAGSLMLVDNKRGILQIKARLGKPRPGRKIEPVYKIGEKGFASWVVQNKRAYLSPNVENDPHFTPSSSGKNFSSVLSVPIVYEDKVLAVINVDAEGTNYFTELHKEKLESLAEQVASPIAERISILNAIAKVGVDISRLPNEGGVDRVLKKIAELAVRSLYADVVTIYPYDQEKDEFPVVGTGPTIFPSVLNPQPMHRKVYPGDVPWTVIKERRPGFYSDVRTQSFLTRKVARPGEKSRPRFAKREGILSMAALLLPSSAAESLEEEVVGVMFVNYRAHHEFNIDEVSALSTFADYAAVAILNARQEQQRGVEQMRLAQMRIAESISANFAHRMSNLAGTSRFSAQMLRSRIHPTDEVALGWLDRIERESAVLFDLAERIASPFKETGGMYEFIPINIAKVLEEELKRIEPDLVHITLTKEVAQNLPLVQSVLVQLHQVLHDIFRNAIEAMSGQETGNLVIRARFDGRTSQVKIEISDTGPGIPDTIRDKLFSPGMSTKEGKLGIGLWWCRTFMEASGGDVILQGTQLGKGTTFVVTIPSVKATGITVSQGLPKKDILIVDDQQMWRDTLADAIADDNYSVEKADSYTAALESLYTSHFTLAIIDLKLDDSNPENKDGLRLLIDMDNAGLDTKVIIVTGHGTEQDEKTAKQNTRLHAYIRKSKIDFFDFCKLVRSAVKSTELSKHPR